MFYLNNTTQEVYRQFRNINLVSNDTKIEEPIEICNNEQFTLDFTGVTIDNDKNILLIDVDWGDGHRSKTSKPFQSGSNWELINHNYNKLDVNESFVVAKIYNNKGKIATVKIPYIILNKSIYNLNTNFRLLQANVSNKNLTQFVMKEGMKDSIIIVSEKDWKELQ